MTEGSCQAQLEKARAFSAATLIEANSGAGAMAMAIKPLAPAMRVCGFATTVHCPPGDNLTLHQAIYACSPGAVLVVEVSGHFEAGYWGSLMTQAALARRLGGLVIDGCVRDSDEIRASGFPVFARGVSIRGTAKQGGGTVNQPIVAGGVWVAPGELVVGDADGVVVVPHRALASVLEAARQRVEREAQVCKQLAAGATTLELFGWCDKR